MPRLIDGEYEAFIYQTMADHPDYGGMRIRNAIIEMANRHGIEAGPPAIRTIEKRVAKIKDDPVLIGKVEALRRVKYPESFGTQDLPWESVPSVLELMVIYPSLQVDKGLHNMMLDGSVAPTTRAAKWYWRLTLAAPHSQQRSRCIMAFFSAFAEITERQELKEIYNRSIESWLLFKPWRLPYETDDEALMERIKIYSDDIEYRQEAQAQHNQKNKDMGIQGDLPPTALELVELGIRPDQWAAHLEHVKKNEQLETQAAEIQRKEKEKEYAKKR